MNKNENRWTQGMSALVARHPKNVSVLSFAMSAIVRHIHDKLLADQVNKKLIEIARGSKLK